jgi:hypothetical protein
MGLSFTIAAGLHQLSFSCPSPAGLMTIFYCLRLQTPSTWRARSPYLYPPGTGWHGFTPRALGSLFVASYDSQGYGGSIRPRPHTRERERERDLIVIDWYILNKSIQIENLVHFSPLSFCRKESGFMRSLCSAFVSAMSSASNQMTSSHEIW